MTAPGAGSSAVVVLSHVSDNDARRLVETLRSRAIVSARIVTDIDLALATWRHEPGCGAAPGERDQVVLPDGTMLHRATVAAIYCRLQGIEPLRLAAAAGADHEYATAELQALVVSWLTALGRRVVNPPVPPWLVGRQRGQFEWLALGARAGLATADLVLASSASRVSRHGLVRYPLPAQLQVPSWTWASPDAVPPGRRPALYIDERVGALRRVLVVADADVADDPKAAGYLRLARLARCDVLEAQVMSRANQEFLVGASPIPRLDNDTKVQRLATFLEQRARDPANSSSVTEPR